MSGWFQYPTQIVYYTYEIYPIHFLLQDFTDTKRGWHFCLVVASLRPRWMQTYVLQCSVICIGLKLYYVNFLQPDFIVHVSSSPPRSPTSQMPFQVSQPCKYYCGLCLYTVIGCYWCYRKGDSQKQWWRSWSKNMQCV